MSEHRTISRRRLPGSTIELSSLGVSIDPVGPAPAGSNSIASRLLQRVWEQGVTTFDLSAARNPLAAEALFASAFPDPDPRRIALVGRGPGLPGTRSVGGRSPASHIPIEASDLSRSIEESRRRLGLDTPPILVWHPGREGVSPEVTGALNSLRNRDAVSGWALAVDSGSPLPAVREGPNGTEWFVGPLSLLDRRLAGAIGARAAQRPVGLIALDPFAQGLLDGSRIASGPGDRPPGAAPSQLRSLEEKFGPVLALAFLTETRRRTLAEAALLYALHWSWVASVVLPLPAPERLSRLLAVESLPPLSEGELARLAVT